MFPFGEVNFQPASPSPSPFPVIRPPSPTRSYSLDLEPDSYILYAPSNGHGRSSKLSSKSIRSITKSIRTINSSPAPTLVSFEHLSADDYKLPQRVPTTPSFPSPSPSPPTRSRKRDTLSPLFYLLVALAFAAAHHGVGEWADGKTPAGLGLELEGLITLELLFAFCFHLAIRRAALPVLGRNAWERVQEQSLSLRDISSTFDVLHSPKPFFNSQLWRNGKLLLLQAFISYLGIAGIFFAPWSLHLPISRHFDYRRMPIFIAYSTAWLLNFPFIIVSVFKRRSFPPLPVSFEGFFGSLHNPALFGLGGGGEDRDGSDEPMLLRFGVLKMSGKEAFGTEFELL